MVMPTAKKGAQAMALNFEKFPLWDFLVAVFLCSIFGSMAINCITRNRKVIKAAREAAKNRPNPAAKI